ncbi:MAG: aminopeptidase [Armatimonadetes bacterium]|nr:aminopeptidase [Armatimonadota bacterium]
MNTYYNRLADTIVRHSLKVLPGDNVLVEATDIPDAFTTTLIDRIAAAEGRPHALTQSQKVQRSLYRAATEEQMTLLGQIERRRMEAMQCYVGVRGSHNPSETSDVPRDRMNLYERHVWTPVHGQVRVPKTRWVVLRWPHPSMAQAARMSTDAFEEYYFRVCAGVDYDAMATALEPLHELMDQTDRVRITGPGTDLSFSIHGIPTVPCAGGCNLPDGEIFTAPVRDSVNGTIRFSAPSLQRGRTFEQIELEFRQGKIVAARCSQNVGELNSILDMDEGARYIGEWSLGVNPFVTAAIGDTLFDEKIAGSFHLTPGRAYDEADNGNRSDLHWDLVCIQRPECGGGEIRFDDVLVRKDGLFVLPQLAGLNPDALGKA